MEPYAIRCGGVTRTAAAGSPEEAARLYVSDRYGAAYWPVRLTGEAGGPGHFTPYRRLPRNRQAAAGPAFHVAPAAGDAAKGAHTA